MRIVGLGIPGGKRIEPSAQEVKFTALLPRHLLAIQPFRSIQKTVKLPAKGVRAPDELLSEGLRDIKNESLVRLVKAGKNHPADLAAPSTVEELVRQFETENHYSFADIWINIGSEKPEEERTKDDIKLVLFLHLGNKADESFEGLTIAIPLNLTAILK
jgi:hypothetical protein